MSPPKSEKLVDRIQRHNAKVYEGKYDAVELEEWIRGMEKIFVVVKVLEEKKLNIEIFYFA